MSVRNLFVAAVIFLMILSVAGPVVAEYHVGDHVDDFTLPNAYGQQISLYSYQDRIVMMPFWFFT
jgi:hypothetical protein